MGLLSVVFLGANFIPNIWDAFQFTGANCCCLYWIHFSCSHYSKVSDLFSLQSIVISHHFLFFAETSTIDKTVIGLCWSNQQRFRRTEKHICPAPHCYFLCSRNAYGIGTKEDKFLAVFMIGLAVFANLVAIYSDAYTTFKRNASPMEWFALRCCHNRSSRSPDSQTGIIARVKRVIECINSSIHVKLGAQKFLLQLVTFSTWIFVK